MSDVIDEYDSDTLRALDNDSLFYTLTRRGDEFSVEQLPVIEAELRIRGMSPLLIEAVKMQQRTLERTELKPWVALIQKSNCPGCNSGFENLNAFIVIKVTAFWRYWHLRKQLLICCPRCANKKRILAILYTSIVGWWSLNGITESFRHIARNLRNLISKKNESPSSLLYDYVQANIGEIVANQSNSGELHKMLDFQYSHEEV